MSAAQHYRDGKLGDTLVDSLDELINTDKITPALAMRILDEFDQVHIPGPTCRSLPSASVADGHDQGGSSACTSAGSLRPDVPLAVGLD